ncbi:hypothetical protein QBC34DRAFT_304977 [Podospora aff. communis PSN243]|uniref:C2H2-type domain-containing protein n=1 Tax=Podospora aff. communis PSN243 TaxID=3040156 RepID=A0AAV9GGI4_9PEZI|nr:hypothetical protein QBC34DRAFT_304977 [Podospora aff. communis PSN243]
MKYFYLLVGYATFKPVPPECRGSGQQNDVEQDQNFGTESGARERGSRVGPLPSGSSGHDSSGSSSKIHLNKRHWRERDDEDDDTGDNVSRQRQKRQQDERPSRWLACPYFKNDPKRYHSWRSCPGPGWQTTHRLKEHLYRCHTMAITCPRCQKTFDSQKEQVSHLAATERCQPRDRSETQGFDSETAAKLRSRKLMQKHPTEEARWKEIYLILFPGVDPDAVPTPYYEYQLDSADSGHQKYQASLEREFTKYETFLKAELPSRVKHQLESFVEETLSDSLAEDIETLKSQVLDIVKQAQVQLFSLYRSRVRGIDDGDGVESPLIGVEASAGAVDGQELIEGLVPNARVMLMEDTKSGTLDGVSAQTSGSTPVWTLFNHGASTGFDGFDGVVYDLSDASAVVDFDFGSLDVPSIW